MLSLYFLYILNICFVEIKLEKLFFVDEFHTVQRGWVSTEIIFISIMLAPHIQI